MEDWMPTSDADFVEIINRLGECRKQLMHPLVADAIDDAFDEAVEALLSLRTAETADLA